jgi:hypothetical protein
MAHPLFRDYSQAMNKKQYFFNKTGKAGLVLNTVLLIALAGSVSYAEGQRVGLTIGLPVVVVAPPVVTVAPDNYVYYPSYGVYYNTTRHQYAYLDGAAWVSRPAPLGVSASVLLASPSVKMDFHDSPANHHEAMVHKYPKNYSAGRSEQRDTGHGDAGHDEHGGR